MTEELLGRIWTRNGSLDKTMKLNSKVLIKLIFPPIWVLIIFVPISAAALVYVFMNSLDTHPLAYAAYVFSFYTLSAVTARCIRDIPKRYRAAKRRVYENPIGGRYMTDLKFRTHVSLFGSLGVNLVYVAANVISGVNQHSAWFFILALYYTILAVMRFLLLRFVNRTEIGTNRLGELKRSRLCGIILLLVNITLSFAVLMILYRGKGYDYQGVLIYVMAAYTFWAEGIAIKNLIKYRRLGSPIMTMAKIISMAAALVSMLSLETAMFSQFGKDMSESDKQLFVILTGAGVSAIVITMSVYSIVKATIEIKKEREKIAI